MAIGAARLFGMHLPLNFHSPYQATGIIDFWRRWHMTFSRFLRDYLYIPLGGNRNGKARRYVNLMLTMTIGGLWHGAAWNFVLWGFLHGLYLVINHGWRALFAPLDRWWSRAIARLVTLTAVILAFVLFRAPDLPTALRFYASMAGVPDLFPGLGASAQAVAQLQADFGQAPELASVERAIAWGLLFLGILWFAPNTQQLMMRFRPAVNFNLRAGQRDPPALAWFPPLRSFLHWRPSVPSAALLGVAAGLALLGLQHVSEFLYFEF
jgi:alginate O-acetyltransferase complex protein AlgI